MIIFLRILIFVVAVILGYGMLKYTVWLVDNIGHNSLADKYLGMGSGGGSHNMWKILGVLVIVTGIYILIRGW